MREAPGYPAAAIIAICIFILIVPCLHHYTDLIGMELMAHESMLENSHAEHLTCYEHPNSSALKSDESFKPFVLPPAANPFDRAFSFSILDPQERPTVLRC